MDQVRMVFIHRHYADAHLIHFIAVKNGQPLSIQMDPSLFVKIGKHISATGHDVCPGDQDRFRELRDQIGDRIVRESEILTGRLLD